VPFLALGLALLAACGAPPPVATAADAQRANVELAELQQGRQLVLSKCSGCHDAPLPSGPWRSTINDMSNKAKLSAEERRLLVQYMEVMEPPRP
jgi:cytochrome c5